eukprot:TRINITY_DN8773_c0_g1_i2.p1 TRINITY_DN8773_c0_g1~~TRINITY_DN8773_c0_g1_i2.p1  ORF type:complete len:771 (-),score=116.95 TRINITY_DN8773_c0_g1_i2:341-2536(-)
MTKSVVVCTLCGATRKRMPAGWTLDNCEFFCPGCWETVKCSGCGHYDPKGHMHKGNWSCRVCEHKKRQSKGSSQHDICHQVIMEDQNGEEEITTGEENSEEVLSMSGGLLDEDAEAAEEDDFVADLPTAKNSKFRSPAPKPDSKPRHIVVLLDASGSMRIEDVDVDAETQKQLGNSDPIIRRLEAAERCVVQFAAAHSRARPQDVFSVAAFHEDVQTLAELVTAGALPDSMSKSPARGVNGTFYSKGLQEALRLLCLGKGMETELLLLSDGRPADTKKALEFYQANFMKGDKSVRLHGIGFGATVESFAPLQQLSCLSGGSFSLSGCSARGLCAAFSTVSSTITSLSCSSGGTEGNDMVIIEPEDGSEAVAAAALNATSNLRRRRLRDAQFEIPEIGSFGKKNTLHFKAGRTVFRYDGSTFHEDHFPAVPVVRRTQPYMRGGMRLVYGFQDEKVVSKNDASWMVAKLSRYVDEALNARPTIEAHAKSTAVARYFAACFNKRLRTLEQAAESARSATLFFVPCFVYEVLKDQAKYGASQPLCFAAERYLPGIFVKYNSNNGYVSEEKLRHQEVVNAFLHFTFQASGRKLIVADLQGVARDFEVLLTDPQVLSMSGEFGPGDLRARGFHSCLMSHRCGPTCKRLGLQPINAAVLRRFSTGTGTPRTTAGHSSKPSSAASLGPEWARIASDGGSSIASDWDRVSERGVERYCLSEGGSQNSEASVSSWAHVLES